MEKTIWICRHGKTEWNLERRKQGHLDSPLAEQGKQQAAKLAEFFSKTRGKLLASSLGRAQTTAQQIHNSNPSLELHTDNRLREVSFGILEGLTTEEIEEQHPGVVDSFQLDPFENGFPDGESYRDLMLRGRSFLDDLYSSEVEEVIIVAHEDINRILLTLLLDLNPLDAINISHPNHVIYKVRAGTVECLTLDGSFISDALLKSE